MYHLIYINQQKDVINIVNSMNIKNNKKCTNKKLNKDKNNLSNKSNPDPLTHYHLILYYLNHSHPNQYLKLNNQANVNIVINTKSKININKKKDKD